MAREKRPAEKTVASRPKRLKISNISNHLSSPEKERQEAGLPLHTSLGETQEDEERLTQEIQSKLDQLKLEHVKRNKACKEFEDRVKRGQTRLTQRIEGATDKIGERRGNFKTQMLPILTVTLQELSLQSTTMPQAGQILTVKSEVDLSILQEANDILDSCSGLISCYDTTASIPPIESRTSHIRNTFETDKGETMRAFESAKRVTINQLQSGIADKTEEPRETFDLDDEEYHLARKVLACGKGGSSSLVKASMKMGSLLYDFGKIVGRMQKMADK